MPDSPVATTLPSPDEVMALLRGVIDPELGSDIVDLGMAKGARVADDGTVTLTIALTTAGCPLRAQIQKKLAMKYLCDADQELKDRIAQEIDAQA